MKKLSIPLFAALLLIVALPVSAAVFHSGEEFSLSQGQVIEDDLYVAGSSISTSGEIRGDVFAAGGRVLINGTVAEDVTAAGGSVDVLSSVGGDVRVSGGQVIIGGTVASDLMAFGGQVHVLSDVAVGGGAVLAGGRVVVDGAIGRDVRIYGNDVQINGTLNGNVEVFADSSFTLGSNARISGDLTYRSPQELAIPAGMVSGDVQFEEHNVRFDRSLLQAVSGAAFTLQLLMLLVAGLLAVVFFGSFTHDFAHFAVPHFGKSLLIGFVLLVVVPVLTVLLLVSFIGAFVALIVAFLYLLFLMVAKVYAGILAGVLLARGIKKEIVVDWRFTIIGIVVLQLVSLVPVIGFLVSFIIALAALGALAYFAHQRFWVER